MYYRPELEVKSADCSEIGGVMTIACTQPALHVPRPNRGHSVHKLDWFLEPGRRETEFLDLLIEGAPRYAKLRGRALHVSPRGSKDALNVAAFDLRQR